VESIENTDVLPGQALAGWDEKGHVFVSQEARELDKQSPGVKKALIAHEYGHAKWDLLPDSKKQTWMAKLRRNGFRPEDYNYGTEEDMAEEAFAFRTENRRYWKKSRGKIMPARMKEPLYEALQQNNML